MKPSSTQDAECLAVTEGSVSDGAADWHSAYIVYRLRVNGLSLRKLGKLSGVSVIPATKHSMPKAEQIIAEALGVPPQTIWPSRFNADGTRRAGLSSLNESQRAKLRAKRKERQMAGTLVPVPKEKRAEYARRARARIKADPQRAAEAKEKRRSYYLANREKTLAKYSANKNKARAYYASNRARLLAKAKAYKTARSAAHKNQQQQSEKP